MGELTIILCSIHMHMQYLHEAFLLGVGEGGKKRPELSGLLAFFCLPCPAPKCLPFFFFFPVEAETRFFLIYLCIYSHRKASKHNVGKKKRNGRDKIWRG